MISNATKSNSGTLGGGLNIVFDNATVIIDQSTFDANSAGEGGGFWISAGVNGFVQINDTKVG